MPPTPQDTPALPLPSLPWLLKATGLAAGLAALLLVLVVLPAEYNLDPTGLGGALGLTRLSAPEDSGELAPARGERTDSASITVPAGKSVEYKFALGQGQRLKYKWSAEGGALFYDFHGEPQGAAKDVFESFVISTASQAKGTFTAPFAGSHGWYWKNRGQQPVTVTLETSGQYEVLGLK